MGSALSPHPTGELAWQAVKVKAFGQNTGDSSIALGARLSQSVHATAVSQRWQASMACASCDTPVGQAAGAVERPSRSVMAAMFIPFSIAVISAVVFCFAVRFIFEFSPRSDSDPTQIMGLTPRRKEYRTSTLWYSYAVMETSAVHIGRCVTRRLSSVG
jgi:hypothetical protein